MNRIYQTILAVGALLVLLALLFFTDLMLFINLPGLLLVVGGTLAGAWLAFPASHLTEVYAQIRGLGQARLLKTEEITELFYGLARIKRAQGVRALEAAALEADHEFLTVGVQMVADEYRPEDVRDKLEQETEFFLSRRESQRAALGFMGRLAPAMGLAGTMVGLIRMLHTLKDPGSVAEGLSMALLTTFYGLMLANLVILPLERKLKEHSRGEAVEMALMTEGLVGLALDENGAAIRARLGSHRLSPSGATAKGQREGGKGLCLGFWGRSVKNEG